SEEFMRTITESQAEYLADKAETDEGKAKIWKARLSDVEKAVNAPNPSPDVVRAALRNHSDKELSNLPPETLRKPAVVKPESMDYDKFSKLVGSNRLTNETRIRMRDARYEDLYAIAQTRPADEIERAIAKMQAGEISKLGDKFFRNDQGGRPAVNQEVMAVLARRGNTDILDKMVQNDVDDTTRKVMREYIENMANNGVAGFDKLNDWLNNAGKGSIF
ncbi:MAG TPA: hypothetical protein VHC46_10530, partial [Thermodesulfobacteriota bacterium]|nr:hypothetical protein [Thermodesulfobacteriota bacterium]